MLSVKSLCELQLYFISVHVSTCPFLPHKFGRCPPPNKSLSHPPPDTHFHSRSVLCLHFRLSINVSRHGSRFSLSSCTTSSTEVSLSLFADVSSLLPFYPPPTVPVQSHKIPHHRFIPVCTWLLFFLMHHTHAQKRVQRSYNVRYI